jgi:hypothetical protein
MSTICALTCLSAVFCSILLCLRLRSVASAKTTLLRPTQLVSVAVNRAGLRTQKLPVQHLAQAALEIMLGHALGEAKMRADLIVEVFLALHPLYTNALLLRHFCNSHGRLQHPM